MPRREWSLLALAALALVIGMPLANALPADSPFHVSNFTLNLFGKFLAYAILALGLDLLWGYTGVLSLGHGVFFGLGAYAMGMHLMLEIGTQSVYRSELPDFMVWNRVTELPVFWRPFRSAAFSMVAIVLVPAVAALVFGLLAFRSRIRGVYFSIITQALAFCAWLVFNRNEMNLGGTNGLADFKTIFGVPLNLASTQRGLYVTTALTLMAAYALCRWITRSRAGRVLVAIRDSETRVLFSGYSPTQYKLFVFVVSAILAGLAGALYVPQVGIITPSKIGVLPSIEMVVWVAAGGRGTLVGAVLGAVGVNWTQSWLTTSYPDWWLLFLGALFMGAVLFFPDGVVGAAARLFGRRRADRPRIAAGTASTTAYSSTGEAQALEPVGERTEAARPHRSDLFRGPARSIGYGMGSGTAGRKPTGRPAAPIGAPTKPPGEA
jgi:urea transport system permease protein